MASSSPGSVRMSCTSTLERRTIQGSTGSDCGIQMFFPSSETEGAAVSFIVAAMHSAVAKSTVTAPPIPPKTDESASTTAGPLTSRTAARIGSSSVLRAQLSM